MEDGGTSKMRGITWDWQIRCWQMTTVFACVLYPCSGCNPSVRWCLFCIVWGQGTTTLVVFMKPLGIDQIFAVFPDCSFIALLFVFTILAWGDYRFSDCLSVEQSTFIDHEIFFKDEKGSCRLTYVFLQKLRGVLDDLLAMFNLLKKWCNYLSLSTYSEHGEDGNSL